MGPAERKGASDADSAHRVEVVGVPEYLRLERFRRRVLPPKREIVVDRDAVLDGLDALLPESRVRENPTDCRQCFRRVTPGAVAHHPVQVVGERGTADHDVVRTQFVGELLGEPEDPPDVVHVVARRVTGEILPDAGRNGGEGLLGLTGTAGMLAGRGLWIGEFPSPLTCGPPGFVIVRIRPEVSVARVRSWFIVARVRSRFIIAKLTPEILDARTHPRPVTVPVFPCHMNRFPIPHNQDCGVPAAGSRRSETINSRAAVHRPMDTEDVFGTTTPLVGMVHLPALPGSPGYGGDRRAIRERARTDARTLESAGFDAVLVENYGDAPYYPENVPRHVVAELTAAVETVREAVSCPVGVNVLRNDATAALSVAAATGGAFVRVNVHTGVRATDQGLLSGQAHETLRLRERIDADVAVFTDVAVKHSAAVAERDIGALAEETIDRGRADGLVVSGPATGTPADESLLDAVRVARDAAGRDVSVFVGSGVTHDNAADLLNRADGAIVGTAVKEGAKTANTVDPERARQLVERVRD